MKLSCTDYFIQYMDEHEDIDVIQDEARYVLKKVQCDEVCQIVKFKEFGFVFHDRVICMKVNLKATSEMRSSMMRELPGFVFCLESDFSEEMYELACSQFKRDRRFHMEESFNDGLAADVISAYTEYYLNKGAQLYSSYYKGTLSGFIMYVQDGDEYENVLGVTAAGIVGRASAYTLYSALMDEMREKSVKLYKGWVSTSNIASVNLHMKLGANVTEAIDKYILRRD